MKAAAILGLAALDIRSDPGRCLVANEAEHPKAAGTQIPTQIRYLD
jgi:hypothetical protein